MGYPIKPLALVIEEHVRLVLESVRGNKVEAAKLLGITRNSLYRRLKKFKGRIPHVEEDSSQNSSA